MYKESSKEFKESIEFTESGNSHDAFNRSKDCHIPPLLEESTVFTCSNLEGERYLVRIL